ncbi:hypothetical protein KQ300_13785 [Synechococcus sp. CS-1331]|nr:hypothetical protein [Synechococcus sp. CS-1331]NQW39868.1 hypothetical protein [Cyanobacteria bacterium bin.275]
MPQLESLDLSGFDTSLGCIFS